MKDMKNLNYSLRYLLKNRGNSITRLISLALGLVVSLLICSYVGINLSYGRFFTDRERVYQIFENSPQFGITGPQLEPVAYTLAENIPSIEAATNYFDRLMQVKLGNSYMDARWLEVSEDFFTVLDFGVLSGDANIFSHERELPITRYLSLSVLQSCYLGVKIHWVKSCLQLRGRSMLSLVFSALLP